MNVQRIKGSGRLTESVKTRVPHIGIAVLTVFLMLFNCVHFISAEDKWPSITEIAADSYIIIDQNTGNVLLEKNSTKKINPASLTKILTAILGIENLSLDQEITVSRAAASLSDSESTIDLISGEVLTFKELLYGMLLSSGNDAAIAIGEKVGGNTTSFVSMMNKKSKELGATNSSWSNPQGITGETHYTTSYDLALITRYALQKDSFRTVVDTQVYSMATTNKHPFSGWNVLENTNKLLRYQDVYFASDRIYEISGVKTGTTTAAGSNLIATAHVKNGLQLICVLNGVRGDNSKNLWAYMRTLFIEASKIADGVQSVMTENTAVTPGNNPNKWFPAQSFSLFIGKNPKMDVLVEKTGNELTVKTKSDNQLLFSTTASSNVNSSEISSQDSSSRSVLSLNSAASQGSLSNPNRTSFALVLVFGIILLIGLCFLLILISSIRKKNNKSSKYYIKRK